MNFEIPAADVKQAFERSYRDIQQRVTIKGFRKGKAPITAIKSMYSDKIKSDVVQNIVQATYWNALKEHKLTPVSQPSIDFGDIQENAPFTFTANF